MSSYTISILRSDNSSALFEFSQAMVTIGRESGEVPTLDPQVSDPQAQLHFDGSTLTLVDPGSSNGTFHASGERVTSPVALAPGSTVHFGGCTLTVQGIEAGDSPAAATGAPAPPAAPPVAPAPAAAAAPEAAGPPAAAPTGMVGPAVGPGPVVPHGPLEGEPTGGVLDQLGHHVRTGFDRYKAHFLDGALTMGLVMVPAALLNAALGWIPILGMIVAIVLGLAQLALAPLSAGAMGRWALAAASGRRVTWKQAWSQALANPLREWLNMAVALLVTAIGVVLLIVPGLVVGMFAVPAYLLEDKRLVDINMRSAELVMKDPATHLGLGFLILLTAIPIAIVVVVLSVVLAFVPIVGGPLASVLATALFMLVLPFIYLLWSQVYYAAVRRLEGTDPVATHTAKLDGWAMSQQEP